MNELRVQVAELMAEFYREWVDRKGTIGIAEWFEKKSAELRAEGEKEKDREKSATNEEHVVLCADLGCVCNLTKDEAFRVAAALRRGEEAEKSITEMAATIAKAVNAMRDVESKVKALEANLFRANAERKAALQGEAQLKEQRKALESEKAAGKWGACTMTPESVRSIAYAEGHANGRAEIMERLNVPEVSKNLRAQAEYSRSQLRAAGVKA